MLQIIQLLFFLKEIQNSLKILLFHHLRKFFLPVTENFLGYLKLWKPIQSFFLVSLTLLFIGRQYSDSINFFAQSLNSCEVNYCCPPVKSIIPVIRKVLSSPMVTMILVIPNWPVSNFWPYLYPSGKFLPEIKNFFTPIFDLSQPSSLFNKKCHSFIAFKIVT